LTPVLAKSLLPLLISSLHALLPFAASFYLSMTLVTLGPALLALPVAALAASRARREGKIDPHRGLAAAAGASLAATGLTGGYVFWSLLTSLELPMWGPLTAAAALAVGVVGGAAFLAVPRENDRLPRVPGLYQGLLATGFGVPLLIIGGGMWSLLTHLLPFLSASSFQALFPSSLALTAYSLFFLSALAPLTFLMARLARRYFPGLNRSAVGLGLLFPPALPFLILSASLLTHLSASTTLTAMVLGNALGIFPHALAILTGLGGFKQTRQELPSSPLPSHSLPAVEVSA
jgi:hypothetical protein